MPGQETGDSSIGLMERPEPQGLHAGSRANGAGHEQDGAAEVTFLRRRLIHAQVDTIMTLVAAVEAKDPYTERHSVHVPKYAERFARAMQLTERETEVIKIAALLHDSGKIGVPDTVLTKPGRLTPEEYTVVKQHPVTGASILRSATSLRRELPLVLHHHEWYNGSGYPRGLKGEDIPLGARILSVADAVDAMAYPRSYKRGLNLEEVASELENCSGTQFDPVVARVALRWLRDYPEELVTDARSVRPDEAP